MGRINWRRVVWDTEPHIVDGCCWSIIMKSIFDQSNPKKTKKERALRRGDLQLAAVNYLVCSTCNEFYREIISNRDKYKKYFSKRR